MIAPLPPPATLGMLGGGQLGRMSILAGRRLGYRFHVYEPSEADGPAAQVADAESVASWQDTSALTAFARGVQRATLEFENIPRAAVETVERIAPVFPSASALHICQHRRREKEFLRAHGFPCAPFAVVTSAPALQAAVDSLGRPCVLKTAAFGYDGKGQIKIEAATSLDAAWAQLNAPEGVLEKWIAHQGEFSVICARNGRGESRVFPLARNEHRHHILHLSVVPAGLDPSLVSQAEDLARALAERLDVIGLLAVELFLTSSGWLVNELAPRPHNSGHYSLDATVTNQFEQHLRAVCGLPLGDTDLLRPVAMLNLLGDLWARGEPDWAAVLAGGRARLHLYGKSAARPGRKMGHLAFLADTPTAAQSLAEAAFHQLQSAAQPSV